MVTTQPATPPAIEGVSMFYSVLDSTAEQVNSFEKLRVMQRFAVVANKEHDSLMAFARSLAGNPVTAALAAQMAEAWGDLAEAMEDRGDDLRRVLMAGEVPCRAGAGAR